MSCAAAPPGNSNDFDPEALRAFPHRNSCGYRPQIPYSLQKLHALLGSRDD